MQTVEQFEEKIIETPHGKTTIQVGDCNWCGDQKEEDSLTILSWELSEAPPSYSSCTCGGWNVDSLHTVCKECWENDIIEYGTNHHIPTEKEELDTGYGEIEYSTKKCECCGELRTKEEITKIGSGVEKKEHSYIFSTCEGGEYSIKETHDFCIYCSNAIEKHLNPQQVSTKRRIKSKEYIMTNLLLFLLATMVIVFAIGFTLFITGLINQVFFHL